MKPFSGLCPKAVAAVACAIGLASISQADTGKQAVPVLKLQQAHQQIGKFIVYVAKDKIRADSEELGYSVLSQAPDWNVYIFNAKAKMICSTSYDHWCARNNLQSSLLPACESPIGTAKWMPVDEHGLPCSKCLLADKRRVYDPFSLMSTVTLQAETKLEKSQIARTSTYIVTAAPGDQRTAWVLNSLYGVKFNPSLPIAVDYNMGSRVAHKVTTTGWSRTSMSVSLFSVPVGFKRMSRIDQVLLSSHGSDKDMDALFGELGVGKDFGDK
ncbi:MAG TPA: hypothetical protein V6C69_11975 [Trichormus sp.]